MRVVFRADSSLEIGTGHVMRCLTLADALLERGAHCSFVCRELKGNLIDLIEQRGFSVASLPSPATDEIEFGTDTPFHAHWLGVDWQTDAAQTCDSIKGSAVDWIVVDHYALDARWEELIRAECKKILVIDDLADRRHDCDLLVDQNLGRDNAHYQGLIARDARLLSGPKYSILRQEFSELREKSLARRVKPTLQNILVNMGGVDQRNVTEKVLNALDGSFLSDDVCVTVVMGEKAPWLHQIRKRAENSRLATRVLVGVRNMAEVMMSSDLAIGASGSTTWERCVLGLPAIQVVLAANQVQILSEVARAGAVISAQIDNIPQILEELGATKNLSSVLDTLSRHSAAITDGFGVSRIVSRMMDGKH